MDVNHIQKVYAKLKQHPRLCFKTPLLENMEAPYKDVLPTQVASLSLKLETMQYTGSFKIRGCMNQFLSLLVKDVERKRPLVTISCGNYGKAFLFLELPF